MGLLQYLANTDGDPSPAVIGNPTSDLPASAREAAAIAAILGVDPLLTEQATVAATVGVLSASSVAHIAAHAMFVADDPLRARILLADGDLPASRLVGSSSHARLVVLSACEAGKGSTLVGAEVLGLVSALTRAGVGVVVASMWSVDDAATAYLMKVFHALVAEGTEPADALSRAQARVRGESGWSAPYFWAGFVVSGRAIRRERTTGA
jgi:CHAT domain-containing protein